MLSLPDSFPASAAFLKIEKGQEWTGMRKALAMKGLVVILDSTGNYSGIVSWRERAIAAQQSSVSFPSSTADL